MALTKIERRYRIKNRIRKVISGTGERPRMNVYRSNKQISVQLVNDVQGVTLLAVSSKVKEIAEITEVSINTALGRMRYALINMRKIMEEKKISLTLN